MDIAFVLDDDIHYYGAGIKPFVDLSLGLTSLGVNSHLLLKKNLKSTEKEIREVTKDKTNLIIYRDLDKEISSLNPEFIMTHDYSMNILKNFTKLKRVVYAQILFGFNSLNPHNMRNSMKFKVGSFVPWSILTRPYVNNINKFDYIIANSEFTRNLLLHLYNVISNGVVYPPVGTNLREYSDSVKVDDKDGMLIYLGHFPDYHIRNVFKEIEFIKNNENMTIRVVADTRENINIKGTELYSGFKEEISLSRSR